MQVHLGFFDAEELAARAYDRASICKNSKDRDAVPEKKRHINFDISDYEDDLFFLCRFPYQDIANRMSDE